VNADGTFAPASGERFVGHEGGVRAVAVGDLAGRPVVVSGGGDGTIRVWESESDDNGSGLARPADRAGIGAVAISDLKGRPVVVSRGADGVVRVWDLNSGESRPEPLGSHTGPDRSLAVGDVRGRTVVLTGGSDGVVRVWDLVRGGQVGMFSPTGPASPVLSLTLGELGRRRVAVWGGSVVGAFDLTEDQLLAAPATEQAWSSPAVALVRAHGTTLLVTGGIDRRVAVWDLATRARVYEPQHWESVTALAVGLVNGQPIVVSGNMRGNVQWWRPGDTEARRVPAEWDDQDRKIERARHAVRAVAVGDVWGRPVVVSSGHDRIVRLDDLASGSRRRLHIPIRSLVNSVAMAPDGRIVVGAEGGLVVFQVAPPDSGD
jgi:WD40 repeat protein